MQNPPMTKPPGLAAGLACVGLAAVLASFSPAALSEELSLDGPNAFRLHRVGMNSAEVADFNYGRGLFRHFWEPVEYSDGTSSGFGPLFNANACVACHIRDGRGRPPQAGSLEATSFVMRLGTGSEERDGYNVVVPDPVYGFQFQDQAISGVPAEGRISVSYHEREVELAGGEVVSLRMPSYELVELGYGPLSPELRLGPRVAPPVIGLGLLENIPVAALIAAQDPNDINGDGISGEINWSLPDKDGARLPGRFGWKLTTTSVREQSENAAAADMGFSTPQNAQKAGDCTRAQSLCLASADADHFGKPSEIMETEMRFIAFYAANLAVPPRRGTGSSEVIRGEALFADIGCAACHSPLQPQQDGQTIAPYTDLLLHDMGEGLADGIAVGAASEREWRTAPLWGIGLTEIVSGHTFFLHDGRARNLTEAILWHGGEGEAARNLFAALEAGQRQNLLAFLNSL